MSDMSGVHGWTFLALNLLVTLGPLFVLLHWPMSTSGGDRDRRKQPTPTPLPPTAPEPIETTARKLPDCLIPRPQTALQEERELEPV